MAKSKQKGLILMNQHEDDNYKMVILGDKETNGSRFASALITFKPHDDEKL